MPVFLLTEIYGYFKLRTGIENVMPRARMLSPLCIQQYVEIENNRPKRVEAFTMFGEEVLSDGASVELDNARHEKREARTGSSDPVSTWKFGNEEMGEVPAVTTSIPGAGGTNRKKRAGLSAIL